MQNLMNEQFKWARETFPGQTLQGVLNHLSQEVDELKDACQKEVDTEGASTSQEEWADVLLLMLTAAKMCGLSVEDLRMFASLKLSINKERKWGPLEEDGSAHHIKEA